METQLATGINGSTGNYKWLDLNPVTGDNVYRILYTSVSGEKKYSDMATVNIPAAQPGISIYPNPVTNRMMTVRFTNMKAGVYELRLINAAGQTILVKEVTHPGGYAAYTLSTGNATGGSYKLEISGSDKNVWKSVKPLTVLN
jgi:hypothetical protein